MAHIPENQTPERDLYGESVLLQELKTQLSAFEDHSEAVVTMKVVDLDSTFTGDTEKGNAVRAKWAAEHQGTIAITSRTAEMTMSSTSYQSSADKGEMLRRPPLFGKVDGKFVYINPENVVAPLIDYGKTDSQTGGMREVR